LHNLGKKCLLLNRIEEVAYPPLEILNPVMGKINYEYIVLWMLKNNEFCTWADFTKKMSGSTLHGYLKKFINKGYINKLKKGEYRITSLGRSKFSELVYNKTMGKRKLKYPPKPILKKRNYDHWILWMLYNNYSCKWSDFKQDPLLINQSSLSSNLNSLIDKGYITKENKDYIITSNGKIEYLNVLKSYDLDRQSILEQESKRIEEITEKTSNFFDRYNIKENKLKFRYISYVLKLNYSKVESTLKNEEDFNKILLFLALNHPDQYPNYISPQKFSVKYKIDLESLNYYVFEIVEKQFFQVKFFKIIDQQKGIYYFQKNEPLEKMLNVIVEKYITQFTYLNKLQDSPSIDIEILLDNILNEICDNLFNAEFKRSLREFLPEYIKYLAYKIEIEKKLINGETKLEGFIWQNVFEEFQKFMPTTTLPTTGGLEEYFYLIDKQIFDVLDTFYLSKLNFFNLDDVQKTYSLTNNKVFNEISKLLYKNKITKARELYEVNKRGLSEKHQLFLKDIIVTKEYNFEESIKITTNIIRKYPKDFSGYLLQSITYFLLDEYKNSLEIIENGLNKAPNILLLCQKAQIFIKNRMGEEIIDEIDEKLSEVPHNIALLRIKILIYLAHWISFTKNREIPLNIIDSAIKLNPHDSELIILKAIFLLLANNYKEAKKLLIEKIDFGVLKKNPKIDTALFFLLTFSYTARGKYDKALQLSNQLCDIYPNHPISYLTRALVIGYNLIYKLKLEESNYNTFLELINKSISLEPLKYNKIKSLLLKINILDGLNQHDKIIKTINSAIELLPNLFHLYNLKIFYLMIDKRELEVLQLIDELIEKFPDLKYRLYEHKTCTLFKAERYDEALEINSKLIELLPEKIDFINNQAMILAHLGKKEEAIETAEHLIKLNPNISNSYDTYGSIYLIFEEYEKAISKFEEVLRMDPSNEYNFHTYLRLGVCYKKLENYDKARECFEKGKLLTERMIPSLRKFYLPETEKHLSELKSMMKSSEIN